MSKVKMKKALQETDSVALTTDIWTSVATEAYMGGDLPLSKELENGVSLPDNDAPGRETQSCKYCRMD